ncbi:MAG: hypothetical protein LBB23_03195 [Rickettsiales bacterium]|jgi:opacity protein-like surface antigen|nr:hypothetical protein [Rickettsiales bacterium]
MKKILAALILCPSAAFAIEADVLSPTHRSNFVMLSVIQPNIMFKTDGEWPGQHHISGTGMGVGFGRRFPNGFAADFDFSSVSINLFSPSKQNALQSGSLMGGVMYEHNIWEGIAPYVGAGVGGAVWVNNIKYRNTDQTGLISDWSVHTDTAMRLNFAYYARAGVWVELSDRFDMDLGVRFQDLGRAPNRYGYFDIVGRITNVQFGIGVAYKW